MTALPTTEQLLPSSQTLSVAFSIAEVAMADTRSERVKALQDLNEAICNFRGVFEKVRGDIAGPPEENEFARFTPGELRRSLDMLLDGEHVLRKMHRILDELLGRRRFHSIIVDATLPLSYSDISEFARELSDDYPAVLRETRLNIISFVATNARNHGLDVIDVSDDFRTMFLSAPIEETEGWQETAHLLADVEDAKLLDQSIKSAARDRTDDIFAAK